MSKPTIPSPSDPPFSLPLSEEEFRRALSAGHGRAWLHASRHGTKGLHDALVHALLHNLAFDPQCEDDRGLWMIGLVDAARAGDSLYPKLIERIHEPPRVRNTYWHLNQRCTVMAALAKRGVRAARVALDQLFTASQKEHPNEPPGASEIIDVDGEKGLRQVCSATGREARTSSAMSINDSFLDDFDRDREDGAALRVLETARREDRDIDHYLKIREARRAATNEARTLGSTEGNAATVGDTRGSVARAYHLLPVEQVIDWIRNSPASSGDGSGWLRGWGSKASEAALDEILRELDSARDPMLQRRYLGAFSRRPMPRVSDHVIRLAEDADEKVRWQAYLALQNVSDPRIREVGLRSLSPELMTTGSLKLMESSYKPGDHAAIEQALFVPSNIEELHQLVFDLADTCAKVQQPECLGLLLFVYEQSPCGLCRSRAIDTIATLGIAPDWLAEECPFDTMDEIRENFGGAALEY